MRMAFMASSVACGFSLMVGRTCIPFNPMLGETYEMVTPIFRMICECVSQRPSIVATNIQSTYTTNDRVSQGQQKFTGKKIEVSDKNITTHKWIYTKMDGSQAEDVYQFSMPTIVVGNLMVGEKYIEPSGEAWIKNLTTGDSCDLKFIPRSGWIVKEKDKYNATAVVKDSSGVERFKIAGNLNTGFIATDCKTG
jgi:hypothetical protein